MLVDVEFGDLTNTLAIEFDVGLNLVRIDTSRLSEGDVGYHKVDVVASYEELDGEVVAFEDKFFIIVNPATEESTSEDSLIED